MYPVVLLFFPIFVEGGGVRQVPLKNGFCHCLTSGRVVMFRQESMLSVVKDNASELLKQFGLEDDMEPMGAGNWGWSSIRQGSGLRVRKTHCILYTHETSAEVEMLPVLQF